MTMPAQKPHESEQSVGTPDEVVRSIEAWRGEKFVWDLAADEHNKKAPGFYSEADDSFKQDWHKHKGLLWLNPPFNDLGRWAEKCKDESEAGARIVMLSPASVSTKWYAAHCFGNCATVFLKPRIKFIGQKWLFPKDLMLTLWGIDATDYSIFDWRDGAEVKPETTCNSTKGTK